MFFIENLDPVLISTSIHLKKMPRLALIELWNNILIIGIWYNKLLMTDSVTNPSSIKILDRAGKFY